MERGRRTAQRPGSWPRARARRRRRGARARGHEPRRRAVRLALSVGHLRDQIQSLRQQPSEAIDGLRGDLEPTKVEPVSLRFGLGQVALIRPRLHAMDRGLNLSSSITTRIGERFREL